MAFVLMSLAFLTLGLLCAAPAQAQGGYPGGPSWSDPTTTGTGTTDTTYTYLGQNYTLNGYPWGTDWTRMPPSMDQARSDLGYLSHVDTSGKITVTRNWTGSGSPPSTVSVLEYSSASGAGGQANGPAGSGTASDAFGDPAIPTTDGHSVFSQGRRLIQVDSSSGTISLSGNVSASGDTPAGTGYQGLSIASIALGTFGWVLDVSNRKLTITADIDPTYHKDPVAGKQPNVAAADGTMTADSVNRVANINNPLANDFGGPTITYFGQAIGSWDPNSSYHWYSAVTGKSDAGTFAISTFPVDYPDLVTSKEHINLHCIDASDGASATANYYVNWHNEWEGLTLDAPNTEVIDSDTKITTPDGVDYPAQENRSTTQMMVVGPLTVSATATAALSAQFSGTFKLNDLLTLGGNFQPSLSLAVQAGQAVSGPPIPPLTYVQLYFHVHYHRNHWLTDHYNASGFDQTYTQVVDGDEKYISLHWGQAQTLGNAGGA